MRGNHACRRAALKKIVHFSGFFEKIYVGITSAKICFRQELKAVAVTRLAVTGTNNNN
jgi:hypothetical protein